MKTPHSENCESVRTVYSVQHTIRLAFIIGVPAVLLSLRLVDPVELGKRLPVHTSCGAITGLPCIFCGMTRALHALLNGNFTEAIYFNWLAIPFLIVIVSIIGLFVAEMASRRIIFRWNVIAPINRSKLTIIGLTLFLLWTLQVYLAVSQHKHELLNRRGPLYSFFVR